MGLLRWLFGERFKVEVTINVPAVHVFVNSEGRTPKGEDRSVSPDDQGGRAGVTAPRVTDEDRLSEISSKISNVKVSEVKFGKDS